MAENKTAKKAKSRFFKEIKSEMKKVTWPSREQLFHNTLVILSFVAITTVVLFLCDIGFNKLLTAIIGKGN